METLVAYIDFEVNRTTANPKVEEKPSEAGLRIPNTK